MRSSKYAALYDEFMIQRSSLSTYVERIVFKP